MVQSKSSTEFRRAESKERFMMETEKDLRSDQSSLQPQWSQNLADTLTGWPHCVQKRLPAGEVCGAEGGGAAVCFRLNNQ